MATGDVSNILNMIDQRKKGAGSPIPLSSRPTEEQYNGPTTPLGRDVQTGVEGLLRNAGGIGVGILGGANKVAEYLSGSRSAMADKVINDYFEAISPSVKGVGGQPSVTTPPKPAAQVVVSNAAAPNIATVAQKDIFAKHGGDEYAALRDPSIFSDQQFKGFVDKHQKDVPGIAYVEDAKTGKITRIAERPQPQEEMINATQAEALSKLITAQGHLAAGVGAREQAAAYQAGILADKAAGRQFDKQKDWENRYSTIDSETQKPVFVPQIAVAKSVMDGSEIPNPSLKGLEEQTKQAYQEHTNNWNTAFNKAYPNSKMTAAQRKAARDRDFLNIFNPPQAK
jgi:hypothetical protein